MMPPSMQWVHDNLMQPIPSLFIGWLFGLMTGFVVGMTKKLRPVEIERDLAEANLAAVLDTIELKQKKLEGKLDGTA